VPQPALSTCLPLHDPCGCPPPPPLQACRSLEQLLLAKEVDPAQLAGGPPARPSAAPLCRFFCSPHGCSRRAACAFGHDLLAHVGAGLLAALRRPVAFAPAPAPATGGGGGGPVTGAPPPFDFAAGDSVLLLGEGDLAFTEALMALTTASLVSSVQLSRQQLLARTPAARRASRGWRPPPPAPPSACACCMGWTRRRCTAWEPRDAPWRRRRLPLPLQPAGGVWATPPMLCSISPTPGRMRMRRGTGG
jgi:hypothetical protein